MGTPWVLIGLIACLKAPATLLPARGITPAGIVLQSGFERYARVLPPYPKRHRPLRFPALNDPDLQGSSGAVESSSSDLALVRGALAGDSESRRSLGVRLLVIPKIIRTLNGRGGVRLDKEQVDDLAQDVFVTVWGKLNQFVGPGSLDPWLYRICQLSMHNFRRAKWRTAKRTAPGGAEILTDYADPNAARGEDPRMGAVESLLSELNQQAQDVIHLHHFDGLTFKEIAEARGVHLSKVKAHYYRGLKALRTRLGISERDSDPKKGASQ